jgi:threonine/homoserine/homoserine lactone efflux protein
VSALSHAAAAFGLGVALGLSPGPVQVLLITESSRGGVRRGLRAMAGANGTFALLLLLLAAGVALASPGGITLRVLRLTGGAFLLLVAAGAAREALRGDLRSARPPDRRATGPVARGIAAVLLNPGAWLFLATTASALVADATDQGGRPAAFAAAAALMAGVTLTDGVVVLLGGGGALVSGGAGRILRLALSSVLATVGVVFLVQGLGR